MHSHGLNAEMFVLPLEQPFTNPVLDVAAPGDAQSPEVLPTVRSVRLPLFHSFGNVLSAARDDVKTSESKTKAIVSGLGVLATQIAGTLKAPSILTFSAAMEGLELTGSPIFAGLGAAACYGALSLIGLQAISKGVDRFSGSFQTAGDNFPRLTKGFSKKLPGFETPADGERKPGFRALARRLGSLAYTHLKRGVVANINGSAYMFVAGAQGQSSIERRKLNTKVSFDGAAVAGLVTGAIAEVAVRASNHHPEIFAQQAQHDIHKPLYLYGSIGILATASWLKDTLKAGRTELPPEIIT
jgi:hypothetical protein